MRKRILTVAGNIAVGLCLAAQAHASTIVGTVNVAGVGGVTVSATSITFGAGGAFTEPAGLQTGSFAPGTGGTLKNLTGPPLTGSIPSAIGTQFATFNGGLVTPIYFDLLTVNPGSGTLAQCSSGAVSSTACTPAGSPFNLQQISPDSVLAGLSFSGVSYDLTGNPKSPTAATFSTQFTLQGTIPQLLAQLALTGSLTAQSYSGNFVAVAPVTTPEPGTMLLMGCALMGLPLLTRRISRR